MYLGDIMKLTNEMIDLAIKSNKKCTYLNEDYVLLYKSMPVEDNKLNDYINALNKLKDKGVNISNVLDYKLIEGQTHSFSNGLSYTKGVFLESRAKGKCIGVKNDIDLKTNEEYDFIDVSNSYLKVLNDYLYELEKRSKASQSVYDKLVSDYISFNEYGLEPDPKPLNFFFDKDLGYTIIDVIPSNAQVVDKKNLGYVLCLVIFGYGLPKLSINYNNLFVIPSIYKERLNNVIEVIEEKLIESLLKNGISKNYIMDSLSNYMSRFNDIKSSDINLNIVIEKTFVELKNNIKTM